MKFRLFSLLALVAALGAGACSDDPTDEGSGEPAAIVTNRSQITATRNVSFSITAFVIDQNNRRVPGALRGSVGGGVTMDSTVYVQELTETRFFMRAAQAVTGTDLTITGPAGLTKTTHIIVQ